MTQAAAQANASMTGMAANAQATATQVNASMASMKASMVAFGKAALAVAGIGGGIMAVRSLTNEVQRLDSIIKDARRLEIDVNSLQQLAHVANLAGTGADALSRSLETFQRRLGRATAGTGPAADALQKLGLQADELNRMMPDERLYAMADAFAAQDDHARRAALATDLFGNAGSQMLLMLELGSPALRQMAEEAEKLTGNLDEAAEEIEGAADAMEKLGRVWSLSMQHAAIAGARVWDWLEKTHGLQSEVEIVGLPEHHQKRLEELEAAERDAAEATAEHARAQQALRQTYLDSEQSIEDFVHRINDQIRLSQGMDPLILQFEKLAETLDLPADQMNRMQQMAERQIAFLRDREDAAKAAADAERKANQEMDQWARRAESLAESIASPAERLAEELTAIEEMMRRRLVTSDIAQRGIEAALQAAEEADGVGHQARIEGIDQVWSRMQAALASDHAAEEKIVKHTERAAGILQEMLDRAKRVEGVEPAGPVLG